MAEFVIPQENSLNFAKQEDDASWAYKNKSSFIRNVYFKRLRMIMSLVDNSFNKVLDIGTGCGILLPSMSKIAKEVMLEILVCLKMPNLYAKMKN